MITNKSKYKLYIASTPIGNLNEISKRFLENIQDMDILLCEDTRVSKKLINLLKINKEFEYVKFNAFNEHLTDQIISNIKNDKKIMLISDAGYPTISDPGYILVNECIKNGIAIQVINGPCSIIHSLVASGISSREFIFLGFIGNNRNERINKLNQYKNINTTFVIFESVHRIKECLKDLYFVFGNQPICIAKELTKLYEEFIYTNLENIDEIEFEQKGEFVIIIEKQEIQKIINIDDKDIELEIKDLIQKELKTKDISNIIADKYNLNSKDVYKKVLNLLKE